MAYNGAAVVAMAGKDCFAIASDRRFGIRQQTMACNAQKLFGFGQHEQIQLGLTGLNTDIHTVEQKLRFRTNLFSLREERDMTPRAFGQLVSTLLYEKRFGPYFCEPVIAGLEEDGKVFLCACDLIGAPVFTDDFVVAGTCNESLYGMCESVYRPNLGPEDLFETVSQALLAAVDRDCLSGWGAEVRVVTRERVITRILQTRLD